MHTAKRLLLLGAAVAALGVGLGGSTAKADTVFDFRTEGGTPSGGPDTDLSFSKPGLNLFVRAFEEGPPTTNAEARQVIATNGGLGVKGSEVLFPNQIDDRGNNEFVTLSFTHSVKLSAFSLGNFNSPDKFLLSSNGSAATVTETAPNTNGNFALATPLVGSVFTLRAVDHTAPGAVITAFSLGSLSVNVVPLPPAVVGGIGLLASIGLKGWWSRRRQAMA